MKKITIVFAILLLCGFIARFSVESRSVLLEKDSPVFSVALKSAVKTLEDVTSAATTGVRVAAAQDAFQASTYVGTTCDRIDPQCFGQVTYAYQITCDKTSPTCTAGSPTCAQWYTCDSKETCYGQQPTCDGSWTCWNSTCLVYGQTCDGQAITCDAGPNCIRFTTDGSWTCDGTPECKASTSNGWPTCDQVGNPSCGPTPSDRTTWGSVKGRFK